MRTLTAAVLFIAMTTGLISCKKDNVIGEGPVTTQTRDIKNFTGIDLQMNGDVYYSNSTEWKVEITAKQSIHGMLETKLVGTALVIRYSNGKTYDEDAGIRIDISGPGVNGFTLNSSGSIYCLTDITRPNVYLGTSGSGNINMRGIFTSDIEASSSRSGRITATNGSSASVRLKTDASGTIDLSAITSTNASARIIGSGDIRVQVSNHLDARIDGSGSVYFRGYPTISSDINGSGRLIRF